MLGRALIGKCEKKKIKYVSSSRHQADITNLESLKRFADKSGPTHIVNCAAYTDVDGAEKFPESAFHLNVQGPENLANLAKEINAKLTHISTNFVFDGLKNAPYLETDICNPLAIYAQTKWEGEQRVLSAFPSVCIIRTSWLFGKGGNNFISSLIHLLKNQQV